MEHLQVLRAVSPCQMSRWYLCQMAHKGLRRAACGRHHKLLITSPHMHGRNHLHNSLRYTQAFTPSTQVTTHLHSLRPAAGALPALGSIAQ